MLFDPPTIPARLVHRYKRFFADVILADGRAVTAHCPNPGAMTGLAEPDTEVRISPVVGRTLAFRLELARDRASGAWVGVNTHRANALVAEALADGAIGGLTPCTGLRREVTLPGGSRIDFRFTDPAGRTCFLEVKSVTLKRDSAVPGLAEFPDARTERGARHMAALAQLAANGARAAVLFLVQRGDCSRFAPAGDIDPAYAAAFAAACRSGVEAHVYGCDVSPLGIAVARPLPIAAPVAT